MKQYRMNYDDLFICNDSHYPDEIMYYLDEELTRPYNGIVEDYFKDVLNWEFEVKYGYRNGMEKVYYEITGELAEENEIKYNCRDGLQKEFFKNGNLLSVGIEIRNIPIYYAIFDEDGNITKEYDIEKDERFINYPHTFFVQKFEIKRYKEIYKFIFDKDYKF